MALSFEELRQMQKFNQDADMRELRIHRLKQNQAEALKVSNLIQDPNWEIFCRYAEHLQREYEARAERQKEILFGGYLPPEKYNHVFIELSREQAFANGIKVTLTIAKTIVEQGEKAAAELKLVDNKDNQA
jgi:hypothetical protein